MQPTLATPSQLQPSNGKESSFNLQEWNSISVEERHIPNAGAGSSISFDLQYIGQFLSFKGCAFSFDINVVGTALATKGVNYSAPMMFQQFQFDSGDGPQVDVQNCNMAYLLQKSVYAGDYLYSGAQMYEREDAKLDDEETATIHCVMPGNLFSGFMDCPLYHHTKGSRITLTTAGDIKRCVTPMTDATVTGVSLSNLTFHYKKIEVPSASNQILAAWATSPSSFMYDTFKVDMKSIDGQSSYRVSNDRTAVQHVAVLCVAQNGTPINYSIPKPLTLRPVNVNLDLNGKLQAERSIDSNRKHMAILSEAMNLDDSYKPSSPHIVTSVLHGETGVGGFFLWETGLERGPNERVRTGLNSPARNYYLNIDLSVTAAAGSAITSGTVANVIVCQEFMMQNGTSTQRIK